MNLFTEIGILFANMSLPVIICLVLGLIFVIIEIFQPGFGVFGTLGGLLLILSIVLRVLQNDGNTVAQIFLMLFLMAIIIVASFMIMIRGARVGWLSRTAFVTRGTAVSTGISEGTENFVGLIGKLGVATTDLRPIGKVLIDSEIYDVTAEGFYIAKGEGVKVVAIEGVRIVCRRAE